MDDLNGNRSDDAPASPTPLQWQPEWGIDLATNLPGHAVLANIASKLTQHEREAGLASDESTPEAITSWAVGYVGEEHIALELSQLDERWKVLHAVPIGEAGRDIDHVVIGPSGVFTINTKHHPGHVVDVKGDAIFIGPAYQPYIPKARAEASRASARLAAVLPPEIPVLPIITVVGATIRHRERTVGVEVVDADYLVYALTSEPEVLSSDAVDKVFAIARRSTTWTTVAPPRAAPEWVADYARRLGPPSNPTVMHPSSTGGGYRAIASRGYVASRTTRSRSGRSRKRQGKSATEFVMAVVMWLVAISVGPKLLTSMAGSLATSLAPTLSTPSAASSAYLAPKTLPSAVPGGPCRKAASRARYVLNDQLLLCTKTSRSSTTWVYADPWLRLPVAIAGSTCSPAGAFARPITGSVALKCARTTSGALGWITDPTWKR